MVHGEFYSNKIIVNIFCEHTFNGVRLKRGLDGMASKIIKIYLASFFARASLFNFLLKKLEKSWRAYNSTIKRIGCIILLNTFFAKKLKRKARKLV